MENILKQGLAARGYRRLAEILKSLDIEKNLKNLKHFFDEVSKSQFQIIFILFKNSIWNLTFNFSSFFVSFFVSFYARWLLQGKSLSNGSFYFFINSLFDVRKVLQWNIHDLMMLVVKIVNRRETSQENPLTTFRPLQRKHFKLLINVCYSPCFVGF